MVSVIMQLGTATAAETGMRIEELLYTLTGLTAGLLDYTIGIGFGLVSSIILVTMFDLDPRIAASVASLVQVVNAIPAFINHYRKGNVNINRNHIEVATILIISSSLGVLTASLYFTSIPYSYVKITFLVTVIILLCIMVYIRLREFNLIKLNKYNKILVALGGFTAGAEKAVSGGGFSVILVLIQKISGIDLKSAIASLPVIKLVPFLILSVIYSYFGFFDVELFVYLLLGGFVSTFIAPYILYKIDDTITTAIITILVIVVILNLVL